MAKIKNKKKANLSELYAQKRKHLQTKKIPSPFEIHVNKDNNKVLGKKLKNDKGLPGVSRAKAIKKRKNTLLQEYNVRNKDNIFLDRRIGEKNGMSEEEKALARFAAEKIKAHKKKDIFNLNDEEILTHRGQSLMDIEKFEDPRSDDEHSDDDKSGKLNKKFVADAHFGGGIFSQADPSKADSRKNLIDQLIIESKKRKVEMQKVREQTIDKTEKLDEEWKDLMPLLMSSNKADDALKENTKADEFDMLMKQLKYEARGHATEKLKAEEEISKEQERQEQVEKTKHKLESMMLPPGERFNHRSADDLDDFYIEEIEDDDKDELQNISDVNGNQEDTSSEGEDGEDKDEEENEEEEDEEEDEEDDEQNEEEEDKKEDEEDDEEQNEVEKVKANDRDEGDNAAKEEENGKRENIYDEASKGKNHKISLKDENYCNINLLNRLNSKLESEHDYLIEEEQYSDDSLEKEETCNRKKRIENDSDLSDFELNESNDKESADNGLNSDDALGSDDNNVSDNGDHHVNDDNPSLGEKKENGNDDNLLEDGTKILTESEEVAQKKKVDNFIVIRRDDFKNIDRINIPMNLKIPKTYEKLKKLMLNKNYYEQVITIEGIIKSNKHKDSQKKRIQFLNLFKNLFQYLQECSKNMKNVFHFFELAHRFCPYFIELRKINPKESLNYIRDILKVKYKKFKKKQKLYPSIGTICLLKILPIIYIDSDEEKLVNDASLHFMSEILSSCVVHSRKDVAKGFLLVSLMLEYSSLCTKFYCSTLNFLRGIIYYCIPKPVPQTDEEILPFELHENISNLLVLNTSYKDDIFDISDPLLTASDLIKGDINERFKIKAFITAINLSIEYAELNKLETASYSWFHRILELIANGSLETFPESVKSRIQILETKIENLGRRKEKIPKLKKPKPKALRMYDPKIEVIYDRKRHRSMSKTKAEREKLIYKLKKETKSAVREIRRDTAFLSKVQIKQQIKSDQERKRKVKEIFGQAAEQQHELKKFKKKK